MDKTDKIECSVCGALMEIPLYCNVGRYLPMPIWCWKCTSSFKYWRYFGCRTIPETEGWVPYKNKPILELEWSTKKFKK